MQFSAVDLADMLLNHPSDWRITEMVKFFPKQLASHLLEVHELEMKHSMELATMTKQREQALEIVSDRTMSLVKVQNELGNAKKHIKELEKKLKDAGIS